MEMGTDNDLCVICPLKKLCAMRPGDEKSAQFKAWQDEMDATVETVNETELENAINCYWKTKVEKEN